VLLFQADLQINIIPNCCCAAISKADLQGVPKNPKTIEITIVKNLNALPNS
jgi:hypothetical protein